MVIGPRVCLTPAQGVQGRLVFGMVHTHALELEHGRTARNEAVWPSSLS
jgi:hypothetical protein